MKLQFSLSFLVSLSLLIKEVQMSEMWPDIQGSRGGVFISSGLSFEKQLGEREECDARSSLM